MLDGTREGVAIRAGIQDLDVLKTTKSSFGGFLRDPYTTLKEDRDRILSTTIRAEWLYESDEIEFSPVWHSVRQTLLETFAEHESNSLQHTLYAMGEAVLATFDRIREIHLLLPDNISILLIFRLSEWTIPRKFFCLRTSRRVWSKRHYARNERHT
jgi:urate oxidase